VGHLDAAFTFELGHIVRDGLRWLYGTPAEDILRCLTLCNEPIMQPPWPDYVDRRVGLDVRHPPDQITQFPTDWPSAPTDSVTQTLARRFAGTATSIRHRSCCGCSNNWCTARNWALRCCVPRSSSTGLTRPA
jgi:hypothetical protein